ncbi:hypothetical protein PORCRE_1305 [Porphyromonas crevioricanis JCM 15906]|uniref:Uncharacterized protein n=1 Tax=Porphyromonas crevioricanis JCM 15906 TaxID=1305617 RepID=T1DS76_9PORP|nr:hypothetical protein PORCRE_1305 [Porphyromonas crevioricanis JCM 15906]
MKDPRHQIRKLLEVDEIFLLNEHLVYGYSLVSLLRSMGNPQGSICKR